MREAIVSVEIIAVPPGKAPEYVRAAWVGLTLPLAQSAPVVNLGPSRDLGPKFLTTSFSLLDTLASLLHLELHEGYLVPALDALAILGKADPNAALWWRENVPHLSVPGHNFLFPEEACRVVALTEAREGQWPPPPRESREPTPKDGGATGFFSLPDKERTGEGEGPG